MKNRKSFRQKQISEVFEILCSYAKFSDVNLKDLLLTNKFKNRKEFRVIMKKVLQGVKSRGFLNSILDQFPFLLIELSIFKYRREHPFRYWYCMIFRPNIFYLNNFSKIENALGFYHILKDVYHYYENFGNIPKNSNKIVTECFQKIFEIVNKW